MGIYTPKISCKIDSGLNNYHRFTHIFKTHHMQRKEFIRNAGLAAASVAFVPTSQLFARKADQKVKMGIIGVGQRGLNHLDLLLRRSEVWKWCWATFGHPGTDPDTGVKSGWDYHGSWLYFYEEKYVRMFILRWS